MILPFAPTPGTALETLLPPGVPWKVKRLFPAPALFPAPNPAFGNGLALADWGWPPKLVSMLLEKMVVLVVGNCGLENADETPDALLGFGGAPKEPKPCDGCTNGVLEVSACGAFDARPPNKPCPAAGGKTEIAPHVLL